MVTNTGPLTYNDKFIGRLRNSLKASRKILKSALEHRETALKAFCGIHYGRNFAGGGKRPVNKIQQAVMVYARLLAARNPHVFCTTKNSQLRGACETFSGAMNALLKEICFEVEARKCVLDALFSFGIGKAGLAPAGFVRVGDFIFDPGQPYFQRVSPDFVFMDLHARSWEGMQYVGDLVLRDFEEMLESKNYQNLDKVDPQSHNQQEQGQTRAETITRPRQGAEDRIFDEIEVLELYIPKDRTILTLSYPNYDLLRTTEHEGPERGPYEMLGYGDVPDNLLPIPTVQAWIDLDDLVNRLVCKLGRQAERQKTLLAYNGADREDARRIINGDDGDSIRVDNPNVQGAVKEVSTGGVRPENIAYVMSMIQQINTITGNIEMLAGISPQSATVGQDQLLAQQAGVQVDDMRSRTAFFSKANIMKLAWYRWNHMSETDVSRKVKGTDIEYTTQFGPLTREGELFDYEIDIEPYSMQPESPEQEYKKLQELLQTTLIPLAPVFQQAGTTFDAVNLTKLLARYRDVKDLDMILMPAPPPPQPEQGGPGMQEPPGKAPVTTRNYVRENRSAPVPRSQENQLIQQMMGAAANNGQRT